MDTNQLIQAIRDAAAAAKAKHDELTQENNQLRQGVPPTSLAPEQQAALQDALAILQSIAA